MKSENPELVIDQVIAKVGKNLVVGTPWLRVNPITC